MTSHEFARLILLNEELPIVNSDGDFIRNKKINIREILDENHPDYVPFNQPLPTPSESRGHFTDLVSPSEIEYNKAYKEWYLSQPKIKVMFL